MDNLDGGFRGYNGHPISSAPGAKRQLLSVHYCCTAIEALYEKNQQAFKVNTMSSLIVICARLCCNSLDAPFSIRFSY